MTSTSSSSEHSEHSSCCSQTHTESKDDAPYEIAGHAWQFPPPEVARMLSPKMPKPWLEVAAELLPLDQHDCMVDEPAIQDALNDVAAQLENDHILTSRPLDLYNLASFLTRCVEACHDALDKRQDAPLRQDRWCKDLRFTVASALEVLSEELASLQPVIGGGNRSVGADCSLYRDPPEGRSANRLILSVETKGSWKKLVSRAFDSARCLFSENQMRSFVLVLAFNQDEQALRSLIFRHGGLTASEPYSIATPEGLKEIARLFLALALWSTPGDAGFVPTCTDTTYMLPADRLGKECALAAVDDILSRSLRIRGRMTLVSRLHLSHNYPLEGGFPQSQRPNFALTLSQTGISRPSVSHSAVKPSTSSRLKSFVQTTVRSSQKWPVRSL